MFCFVLFFYFLYIRASVQVLGAIGLLALFLTNRGEVYQYSSTASTAFVTTLILLIVLLCIPSLRSNQLWSWVELIITVILTIIYIIATIYIFKDCWNILFNHHGSLPLTPFIGSLIATVCIHIVFFFGLFYFKF